MIRKIHIKKLMAVMLVFLMVGAVSVVATSCDKSNQNGATDEVVNEVENKEPDVITETSYGDLHFPGKWKDDVFIETDAEDPYTVSYYGVVDDEKYLLFSLVFGESDGYCLGTFDTEEGNINMYIEEGKLDNIDHLSDKKQKQLYDMQINVNYILQNLEDEKGFSIN